MVVGLALVAQLEAVHPQLYSEAFTYTAIHEASHYLGLAHPHDTIGAVRAADGGWCDLFNLRLSKCGGFVPTLRLAQFAARHGVIALPGSTLSADESHTAHLRLPFLADVDTLARGVDRLARAWRLYRPAARPHRSGALAVLQ